MLGSSFIGYAMDEGAPSGNVLKEQKQVEYAARSSLYLSAAEGKRQKVELLLSTAETKTITHIDRLGWTALHAASHYGHLDIVEDLVSKHPALLGMETHSGKTAQDLAYDEKWDDIVTYLTNKTKEFGSLFSPDATQRNFTTFLETHPNTQLRELANNGLPAAEFSSFITDEALLAAP